MKISVITALLLFSFFSNAQSLEEDLSSISEKMRTSNSISIDVSVDVRMSIGGASVYSAKAEMHKMGENSRSVLDEMEVLHFDDYDLRLDHDEKMILIVNSDKLKEGIDPGSMDIDVKALRKLLSDDKEETSKNEFLLLSDDNGIRKYSITGVQGLNEITVELDMTNFSMKSIVYEYESNDMGAKFVELKYTSFEYDNNLSEMLDPANYFKFDQGDIVLNENYKQYTLYTEE